MPRSNRHRRQELRHRRRQARRSLNLILLDDDFVVPDEDWNEPLLAERLPERHELERAAWLHASDKAEE
jgi:hypothetical protein